MTLVFNKCCCCIDLRTGCFIIGYLNLISTLIVIALDILVIVISKDESSSSIRSSTGKQAYYIIFLVSCAMMILLAVALAFVIVLLVGLHEKKRGHVKAYLIYALILGVLYIIQYVALIILVHMPVWRIIIEASSILLNAYFLLCLKSYYLRMGGSSKRPTIYNIGMA